MEMAWWEFPTTHLKLGEEAFLTIFFLSNAGGEVVVPSPRESA